MPNKFTTTHSTGKTAKRTSENRTYTHAVWIRQTAANLQRRNRTVAEQYRHDAFYCETQAAAGGEKGRYLTRNPEELLAAAKEYREKAATLDKEHAAGFEAGQWGCVSWAGSLELARKSTSKWTGGFYDVEITEAVLA